MIRDIIIPSNSMFAILVRVSDKGTQLEQYMHLSDYWFSRLNIGKENSHG